MSRLVQCYRCRRLFVPSGGRRERVVRFCPDCAAELRRTYGIGASGWLPLLVVLGGISILILLSGRRLLPTLLAVILVAVWYFYQQRR